MLDEGAAPADALARATLGLLRGAHLTGGIMRLDYLHAEAVLAAALERQPGADRALVLQAAEALAAPVEAFAEESDSPEDGKLLSWGTLLAAASDLAKQLCASR